MVFSKMYLSLSGGGALVYTPFATPMSLWGTGRRLGPVLSRGKRLTAPPGLLGGWVSRVHYGDSLVQRHQ